jgi:glycosyltransferase involved in cell wall biosynthesis
LRKAVRILHLTTFVQGGAGLAMTELTCGQARRGHEVTLVTSRTGAPGYGNYSDHLARMAREHVRVIAVDSLFSRNPEHHAAVSRTIDRDLGGASAFDLIHAHAAVPASLGAAVVARARRTLPVLQTMHGWGVSKTTAHAVFDVQVMNQVDRLVVPAPASAALLASMGVRQDHQAIVPYGIPDARDTTPDDLSVLMRGWRQAGHHVLCAVGTLGARKNQRLLIEALAMDDSRVHRLVIIGDGPRTALTAAAISLGVADRVYFAGYRPDARRYLREADLLVLPSRAEGQPLTILEAFCDGTPVLVSAVPELSELVVPEGAGWTFIPDNARDLAAALARAARVDPADRQALIERARSVYRARFTVDRMVDDYMTEYGRVA